MAKDSAAGIELGRSFLQEGTFNLKVCESKSDNFYIKVHLCTTLKYYALIMHAKIVTLWICTQYIYINSKIVF